MDEGARAALTQWLAADPEHRRVLARYRQLSAEIESRVGALLDEAEIQVAGRGRRTRRWRVFTALGAAAAVVMGMAVATREQNEFATKRAERHAAVLMDGSRIELNAQTELRIEFDRGERRVRLVHGEALFDVAKETARPFVVETPAGRVQVTGTVFNIRATQGQTAEVTVLDGRVQVRSAEAPSGEDAVLAPGEQAVMSAAAVTIHALPPGAAQDVVAWREGRVVFDGTPLREAVERFANYHGRILQVDARVGKLSLGGRFSLDDIDGLLDEIERVFPVRVVRESSGVVRILPREPSGA